ncbi:arylamine N-acetyltransferase family protein [Lewinella sp. IMCC34191]|uniref:arylamine N-acetyltransferase family protein n=1 Tax=Lewinella sp. IMCC34191 TaxID=2259172 RepID=UPI000E26599E|nr:arylamine N-acetyltransferase [Lewinella sp. IMCC34191]
MYTSYGALLVNRVELDGAWYVSDVGFGGLASRVPLRLDDAGEVDDGDGTVRLLPQDFDEYLVQRNTPDGWQDQYRFETRRAVPADIKFGNYYTHSHPDSHFLHHRFIGLFTDTGRIGLFGNRFTERRGIDVVAERTVPDGPEWIAFVRERFGLPLELPGEDLARLMVAKAGSGNT